MKNLQTRKTGVTPLRAWLAVCFAMLSARVECAQMDGCTVPPACSSLPACDCGPKVCRPHFETEKIKKQCYAVECRQICVPPVRCPWSKCCEPGCGRVKTIRVLKKHEHECGEKCVWKWQLEDACPPSCDSCGPSPQHVPAAPPAVDKTPANPALRAVAAAKQFRLQELFD